MGFDLAIYAFSVYLLPHGFLDHMNSLQQAFFISHKFFTNDFDFDDNTAIFWLITEKLEYLSQPSLHNSA